MRRASGSVVAVLVLMMGCVMVEPCSAAAIDGRDFNVLDYGAVGDGTTEDTAAIRRAAAALAAAGGSRNFTRHLDRPLLPLTELYTRHTRHA